MKIAILFAEEFGSYYGIEDLDIWHIDRDATNYNGSEPVIAHPPCNLWGKMANVNYARWGGEHNRPGNDGGLFKFALDAVNRNGGVLEHPAQTYAWKEYKLLRPTKGRGMWIQMSDREWVCEVWQSAYGHLANKATWLYYVGNSKPFDLNWSRPKGSHQIGQRDQRGKNKNKPTVTRKQAISTPTLFRDVLIKLARFSQK